MHTIETLALDPNSPYWRDGHAPEPVHSVAVFVDILGFTERIRQASEPTAATKLLGDLRSALNRALVHVTADWMQGPGIFSKRPWDYKAFTDNIVLGFPIRDDGEPELGTLFRNLAMFQLELIQSGFFVRGAIAVGDLYMDRDIVFGTALLEAYDTEQSVARDPRIVLAPSALTYVNRHLTYYANPCASPQNSALVRDADRQVFVNYLDSILIVEDDYGPFFEPLMKHKSEVEKALDDYRGEPRVWSKYNWVARYHNYFCTLRDDFTAEHRIDLASLAPEMQPLVR